MGCRRHRVPRDEAGTDLTDSKLGLQEDVYGKSMTTFDLMSSRQSGLMTELLPGSMTGHSASTGPIFVSEGAFGFLEPSVRKCCPRYTEMSHWGVTEISRAEWDAIIKDWQVLAGELGRAPAASDFTRSRFVFSDVDQDFTEDFEAYRSGLMQLIHELSRWLENNLSSCQFIAIKGI